MAEGGNDGRRPRRRSAAPRATAHRIGRAAPASLASRRPPGARLPRPAGRREAAALEALARAAFRPVAPRFGTYSPLTGLDIGRLIAERTVYVLDEEAAPGDEIAEPAALMVARPGDRVLVIRLVAVRPDRQGRGLGRALVAYGEALARLSGLGRVELMVEQVLWEQVARYARLGYQPVDEREVDGVVRLTLRKDIG